ncbi:MAG: SUF system NifU family Fe-S cluster assembly protein [Patescibacteria group bacterium]|nr:SUF system NifU family Fe-S cluster assembly protein [Patescibacteria group bacterium]
MDLYQEEILEHYHDPHNNGKLDNPTHERCANNPTCGDKICVTIDVINDVINDVNFEGEGCAISQAATSMITDKIKGGTVQDALDIKRDDMTELLGIEISIGRIRCALLGIETIQKALEFGKIDKK